MIASNVASKLTSRTAMISIILILFASIVLSHPTNSTGYTQPHLHNCSIYHANATCNCTTSVSPGSQTNQTLGFGFVGQQNNLTMSYGASAKKGKGGSGSTHKSTARNLLADAVYVVTLTVIVLNLLLW
ncbi:hypothetical protein F5Y05DRAFT_415135 [Hypoxylon sp. FL0543]|nr:hypothetical protein F5Y05DRAFT_415135 [Hypoxylon sp. FL0543]